MTNEHNSIKTLLQNTGVVKSINRGVYKFDMSAGYNTVGSFNVNPDKSILIIDQLSDRPLTNMASATVRETYIEFIANGCFNGIIYWQVVEFY